MVVLKKSFAKLCLRSVRKSITRFLSIFGIVALGSGFLAGLVATTPDMRDSASDYFNSYNVYDIDIKGSHGLSQADTEALCALDGVSDAVPAVVYDAIMSNGDDDYTTRIYGVDTATVCGLTGYKAVNMINLYEGRMPENDAECIVTAPNKYTQKISLGDTLTVSENNKSYDTLSDTLTEMSFTIVGFAHDPRYISIEGEPSSTGTGTVNIILYVNEHVFDTDVYTDIFVTLDDTATFGRFTAEYHNYVDTAVESITPTCDERCEIRRNELIDAALPTIDDARAEYESQKKDTEGKLSEAKAELDAGAARLNEAKAALDSAALQISDGRTQLAASRSKAQAQFEAKEKELAEAKSKIDSTEAQLQSLGLILDEMKPLVDEAVLLHNSGLTLKSELQAKLDIYDADVGQRLDEIISELQKLGVITDSDMAIVDAARDFVSTGIALSDEMSEAADRFQDSYDNYLTSKTELDNYKTQYVEGLAAYNEMLKKSNAEFAAAQAKLDAAEAGLDTKTADYNDGVKTLAASEAEYDNASAEADAQLDEAKNKLDDAERQIREMDTPEWYVLTLTSNVGYNSYDMNSGKVEALSKVFPVFFFVVAALVALTTMTRMVEEERSQIGTMRALGYRKRTIMAYYLGYSLSASLLGAAAGVIVGFRLFPAVIINAYSMMYSLPVISFPFRWNYALVIIPIAVACTTAATLAACVGVLSEKPAALMLPKIPKAGKRVFLERFGFIWKHLKFTQKVTVRNLCRYKKRLFMTVIGIAGCTALLVTGFGVRNSIDDIIDLQFGSVYKYDLSIYLTDYKRSLEDDTLQSILNDTGMVSEYGYVSTERGAAEYDDSSIALFVTVVRDTDKLTSLYNLVSTDTDKTIIFRDSSAVLSKKAADKLGLSAGDTLTVRDTEGKPAAITVTDVFDIYVENYIFISENAYVSAYGTTPDYNALLAVTGCAYSAARDALSERIFTSDNVAYLQFASALRETFDNMVIKIDFIVIVLILSAGLLAGIVIYNLTNINICERRKELGTLKVLGFHEGEVSMYIYRETIILTLIGIVAGFFLGIWLHGFVMSTVEMDNVMFGRTIYASSYIFSALLTILFAVTIDIVMLGKMKKIDMVEAVKAND